MSLPQTIENIQSLTIQGATAVAKATLLEMAKYGKKLKAKNSKTFIFQVKKAGEQLAYARPTEPMAQNLVEIVITKLNKMVKQGADIKQAKEILEYLVKLELRELEEDHKQMIEECVKIIKNRDKILTFCHSSSVEKILKQAKKTGKKFKVFVPETRPLQAHYTLCILTQ